MASQTFTIVTLGGHAAEVVRNLFSKWEAATRETSEEPDSSFPEMDSFCDALRKNRTQLPILYYAEWVDRWLFGQDVSPLWITGKRFQTCCLSRAEAAALPASRPSQSQEESWLFARLLEATAAGQPLAETAVILIIREVFSGSVLDAEIVESLSMVPDWLSQDFGGIVN